MKLTHIIVISLFHLTLSVTAQDFKSKLTYANVKASSGDYEGALSDYNFLIMENPGESLLYFKRGQVLFYKKEFEKAIQDFEFAYKADTSNQEILYFRGLCKIGLEDYEGAVEDYSKAISLDPYFAVAYLERGLALLEMGKKKEGCEDIKKAQKYGVKIPTDITCE